ncbi:MAG: hypothetical protein BMS9Abin02_0872 [Anaerolineae bacterium]|nr:MAG: hypothetical protein BMS9Abin02_0872 [Anaerolineae bacterium]
MFKFVTIYRRVDDEDRLEDFFSSIHLQLAEQLPGLVRTEVSRVGGKPGGESRFHLMYELYFQSEDDFFNSLGSMPGRKMMASLKEWADAKLVTWFYADSWEEEATQRAERS